MLEVGELGLDLLFPGLVGVWGVWCGGFRHSRGRCGFAGFVFGQQVHEGFDAASAADRDALHERAVGILDEPGQGFLDLVERVEMVHALGALLDLAGSLLAAQEELRTTAVRLRMRESELKENSMSLGDARKALEAAQTELSKLRYMT